MTRRDKLATSGGWRVCAGLCLAMAGSCAAEAGACVTSAVASAPRVRVEAATPAGDLRLGDGRLVRLAFLQTGAAAVEPARLASAIVPWRGRDLALVTAGDGQPDRWGRIVADLVDPGAADGHLGLSLLASGNALVEPGHPDAACRAALSAAETQARVRRAGVWNDPARRAALKASDGAAVSALRGQHAVIEGRIISISERNTVVYLNFARRWRDGATVTVSRKLWREMAAAGWNRQEAEGRIVRVRGIVEDGNGPVLALSSGAAIEALD